jgi:hypothetical protein
MRRHLSLALDLAVAGPVRLVSLCAGQGHDVIGVLPGHRRRGVVSAVLVEADPRNAELACSRAAAVGLDQVHVRQADAGRPRATPMSCPPRCCCCAASSARSATPTSSSSRRRRRRCALRARR